MLNIRNKGALKTMEGLQKVLEERLTKMQEGPEKERLKEVVAGFIPAFKRALQSGDVSALVKLQEDAKKIEKC